MCSALDNEDVVVTPSDAFECRVYLKYRSALFCPAISSKTQKPSQACEVGLFVLSEAEQTSGTPRFSLFFARTVELDCMAVIKIRSKKGRLTQLGECLLYTRGMLRAFTRKIRKMS